MISPWMQMNLATIRAERRAHLCKAAGQVALLLLLAAITLTVAQMILTTALALPLDLARAEALKGM